MDVFMFYQCEEMVDGDHLTTGAVVLRTQGAKFGVRINTTPTAKWPLRAPLKVGHIYASCTSSFTLGTERKQDAQISVSTQCDSREIEKEVGRSRVGLTRHTWRPIIWHWRRRTKCWKR